ncbi:MAG: CCA tRNA nucleotidyltransferase [Gemmatimonadetes bacterium]|nr:CCA tRNA nucleotidyltransferase [Gemmatimonadota bacterium]
MACVHANDVIEFPRSLPIPEEVLDIARRLEAAGFETWCVGGAVRDNLLGYDNRDFDLATAALPEDVQRLFRRTIPVGVEHGTVAVLDRNRQAHEVTTFRRDVRTDGRHAVVEFGVKLEDDLARRDFTINAIAHHPLTHAWRDLFDGRRDLDARLIRAVGDPAVRFREDYLRILRALRFAARFDFQIDPATWAAAQANADGLGYLSAERVRDEWFRGLASAQQPSALVRLWDEIGGRAKWLPEVDASGPPLAGIDRFPVRDPVLMTAYLSQDPRATLERLRCSGAEIERGVRIQRFRERPVDSGHPTAVRRWLAEVNQAADDLVTVAGADDPPRGAALAAAVGQVRSSGAPVKLSQLAVTGEDLIAEGVPADKRMGEILRRLLDAVLEDPARNNRDALLDLARALAERYPA